MTEMQTTETPTPTIYDTDTDTAYLAITADSRLLADDDERDINMPITPAALRALAREITAYTRTPLSYEGDSQVTPHGELYISERGLLEIIAYAEGDPSVQIDLSDTEEALALVVMLLDAAEELAR